MNIYVASSWRNDIQPIIVDILRRAGHEVYDFKNPPNKSGFGWEQINKQWEKWSFVEYKKALIHPLAIQGFESDFNAMTRANACIIVLPCGRSAHTEAGFMKGCGKTTILFSSVMQEPELMYKIFDLITDDISEVLRYLSNE